MKSILILLFGLFNLAYCFCQFENLRFTNYTTEDGLPHNLINDCVEDKLGILWFTSEGGLIRFDGYNFKIFTIENIASNINVTKRLTSIDISPDEVLWLGSTEGLYSYDIHSEKFQRHLANFDVPFINAKYHQDGRVICATDYSVIIYNTVDKSFREYNTGFTKNFKIAALIEESDSTYWFSVAHKGLFKININNGKFFHYPFKDIEYNHPEYESDTLFTKSIFSLINHHGRLWLGTTHGLIALDLTTNKFEHFFLNNPQLHCRIQGLNFMHDSPVVFIASSDNGLIIFDTKSNRILDHYKMVKYDKFGLKTNNLTGIYYSRKNFDGTVWFFSSSGLINCNLHQKQFKLFYDIPENEQSLSGNRIRSVFEDSKSRLWIGTIENGITVLTNNRKNYHKLQNVKGVEKSIGPGAIGSFAEQPDGKIWATTWLGSINLIEPDNLKIKRWESYHTDFGLTGWSFIESFVDNEGNLLISPIKQGLRKINITNGLYKEYFPNPGKKNSLHAQTIHDIYNSTSDPSDILWLATSEGLVKFNTSTNTFTHYFDNIDSIDISGELPNSIFAISEDNRTNFWLSTRSNGLCYFDRQNQQFIYFNSTNGLGENTIYAAYPDKQQHVWLMTGNSGIIKFTPPWIANDSILKVETFDRYDGVQGKVFNWGAHFQNPKTGEIFFGGDYGLNAFYPDSIKTNPYPPGLVFNNLYIKNKEVGIYDTINDHVILKQPLRYSKQIDIHYKNNDFSIELVAIHFGSTFKNQYRYMLKGYDEEWRETTTENRKISYSNLPAGHYELHFNASNSDGIWNETDAILKITVHPPWWKTLWFRITAILAIAIAIIAYYKYKTHEIKKQNELLEKQVAQRTSELSEANEELEAQKDDLEEKNAEIEAQNDQLAQQKEQISKAFNNVKVISEFGQRLTSTLSMDSINQMIYEYVSSLMDTAAFGIGVFNTERKIIEFFHFVENGEVLPYFYKELSSENSLSVRCLKNKEEIVINDLSSEYKRYLKSLPEVQTKQMPESMIHIPLTIQERAIGTITINSFKKNAYSDNDITNLRSLASYISIALDNANVYKVVNEQNEHIRAGIDYAKTIQQAILPIKENMNLYFQSFILFRPKDVVSGDFYYFTPVSEGACILAVIDCTGHGVPGAFMSMIGNRLLNDIINGRGIESPAQILEELDKGVQKALKQDQTANNDGMDACVVRVSVKSESDERPDSVEDQPVSVEDLSASKNKDLSALNKVQITFSGAMRPLYYIEAGSTDVKKLKGDRRSIGGMRTKRKQNVQFTDQVLKLDKGSQIYLFSDGYTDQNNSNRDKLGVVNFAEILENNANKSLEDQKKTLEELLDKHQGIEDQLDDITVVGVKLR